jgi:hypothetical protein
MISVWGSYVLGGAFVHTPGQPVYVGEWQWIRLNGTENLKFKPFVEKLFRPSSEKNWYFSRAAYISGTLKVEDMHDRNYFICEDVSCLSCRRNTFLFALKRYNNAACCYCEVTFVCFIFLSIVKNGKLPKH